MTRAIAVHETMTLDGEDDMKVQSMKALEAEMRAMARRETPT